MYLLFSNDDGAPEICFRRLVNSSSFKRLTRSVLFGSLFLYSFRFSPIGQSVIIVASSLLSLAKSAEPFSISASFGFLSLSIFDSRFSMLPNSAINADAVFSPIPCTPGILSAVSPIRPIISIILSGATPNLPITSFSS